MSQYTRMFPQLAREPATPEVECGLAELGKRMKREEADEGLDNGIPAGFTYLGQMMDHDLTFDITPLKHAHPCEDRIQNFRTPFLDMDFLYGGGPTVSPFLYDQTSIPGEERFLIGKTRNGDGQEGPDGDLPRNPRGIALVGDPRQDENLIVAQLHVYFLNWHNRILKKLPDEIQNVSPARRSKFEQARRLLTWIYQKFAVTFLESFVDQKVFKRVQKESTACRFLIKQPFRIPIEFNVAAFRFGHSMVRDSYNYNKTHTRAKLSELLTQTGMGGGACPSLREDWRIDMSRFFRLRTAPSNRGQKIRPRIARDLFQLPPSTIKLFNVPPREQPAVKSHGDSCDEAATMLPVRTLWRGARMGLPSGQDIAKVLSTPNAITTQELAGGPDGDLLHDYGFDQDTPLWYYILREAELRGDGDRLGPVGSWIVTATIFGALRADPNSYLSIYPQWEPSAGLGDEFALLISSFSASDSSMADSNT